MGRTSHTVRVHEAIRDNSHRTRVRIKSIDLIREARGRSKVLQIPVRHVGKVDLAVTRVDRDVV